MDIQTSTPAPQAPARFATYGGDQNQMLGSMYGPTTQGEMLRAVSADYNPDTDTTRVGFAFRPGIARRTT